MRDPFTAMKSGRKPEGIDTLYRFGAIARALSRTSEAADVATTGEGLGSFVGSVDAVGVTLDAAGADSVVGAELGRAGVPPRATTASLRQSSAAPSSPRWPRPQELERMPRCRGTRP